MQVAIEWLANTNDSGRNHRILARRLGMKVKYRMKSYRNQTSNI
jgi:hypothetical protein